jgi:hypothetical protein
VAVSRAMGLVGVGVVVVAVAAAQVGWAASTVTDTVTRSLAIADTVKLKLGAENGSISVEPYGGTTVAVEVWMQAKAPTNANAQRLLKAIRITSDESTSLDELIVRQPRTGLGEGTQVRVTVKVPRGWAGGLDMSTVNGAVAARGLHGPARMSSENGSATVSDWTGSFDLRTTNGEVAARTVALTGKSEFTSVNGGVSATLSTAPEVSVTLHTTNGGLKLRLPAASKVSLSADTVNGRISVTGLGSEMSARGGLTTALNGGGTQITLRTTNGSVEVSGE